MKMIEPERIRAIVKSVGKLEQCPMDATMNQLDLDNAQLQAIQRKMTMHFQHTVSIIYFKDTIYDITDRLNKKPQRESA